MSDYSGGCAYVDGRFVPPDQAKISIFDMGFLLSDATYDAVHVWDGAFFRLEEHLERFEGSVAKLRMELPCTRDELREILMECVRRSGLREALVEMIVTRGRTADGRRDLRLCRNNLIAFAAPFVWIVEPGQLETGVHLAISENVRRIPADSVDPTVKNFNRLDFSQALFEAYDRGADYAVLIDHDGNITEGLGYNVFALVGGRLLSPESGVLEGITRSTIFDMARETNLKAELALIGAETLRGADEIFLASTAGGIMPVTTLDGKSIGDGTPGPVTQRLAGMYWEWHRKPEYRTEVDYGQVAAAGE